MVELVIHEMGEEEKGRINDKTKSFCELVAGLLIFRFEAARKIKLKIDEMTEEEKGRFELVCYCLTLMVSTMFALIIMPNVFEDPDRNTKFGFHMFLGGYIFTQITSVAASYVFLMADEDDHSFLYGKVLLRSAIVFTFLFLLGAIDLLLAPQDKILVAACLAPAFILLNFIISVA